MIKCLHHNNNDLFVGIGNQVLIYDHRNLAEPYHTAKNTAWGSILTIQRTGNNKVGVGCSSWAHTTASLVILKGPTWKASSQHLNVRAVPGICLFATDRYTKAICEEMERISFGLRFNTLRHVVKLRNTELNCIFVLYFII